MDHRHVKYQSLANLSWFIGFDQQGNPISGLDLIKRDVLKAEQHLDAIDRERCYLFSKRNRLTTNTMIFPEAMRFIEDQQSLGYNKANSTDTSKLSSPDSNPAQEQATSLKRAKELQMYQSAQLSKLQAKRRGQPIGIQQKDLINMIRYRNILRYQMRKKL